MDKECPTCGRNDFESRFGLKQHHARTHGEKLPPDKVQLTCERCGESYQVYPNRVEESKYCSTECANNDHERQSTALITAVCDYCGDEYEDYRSKIQRHNRQFCCQSCYADWRSENVHGENHPQWEGGNRGYGEGWNENKRRNVRERDGFQCVWCGMTQESHKDQFGSVLSVHHIRPARTFDSPEERNAPENLITLCRQCHHRWEGIPIKPDLPEHE